MKLKDLKINRRYIVSNNSEICEGCILKLRSIRCIKPDNKALLYDFNIIKRSPVCIRKLIDNECHISEYIEDTWDFNFEELLIDYCKGVKEKSK
jgi:hypothetical protein